VATTLTHRRMVAAVLVGLLLPAAAIQSGTTSAASPPSGAAPDSTIEPINEPGEPTPLDVEETDRNTTDTTVAESPETPTPDDPDETPGDDDGEAGDGETAPRPGLTPQVRDSGISAGTVVLAVLVLLAVAIGTSILARRTPARRRAQPDAGLRRRPPIDPGSDDLRGPAPAIRSDDAAPLDAAALDLLVDLGEALIDAGDAVGHVEATLHSLGRVYGIDAIGVLALPTSLVVSVPADGGRQTEVGTAGRGSLRLDQIDDVIRLVDAAERGEVSAREGSAELARIRSSRHPYRPATIRLGHVLASIGVALLLRGGWREVLLAGVLGVAVSEFRWATQRFGRPWQPFWPLLTAAGVSTVVLATARIVDDLAVFPALAAPLIMFLPGGLLTTAVLELATGQIVAGAARVASGVLQLLLLALGIVAGARLIGVPPGDIQLVGGGVVAEILPWVGVAVFGVGVVWFNGARGSTLAWILISMYAAYAGQVIGGLFFGAALSAFFGAATMTPVALIAARQPTGPTPLVTFLPGFWVLVPGALGLEGVTRIISEDGAAYGAEALTTTVVSMVGISLGILVGLISAARDPDRPWSDAVAT